MTNDIYIYTGKQLLWELYQKFMSFDDIVWRTFLDDYDEFGNFKDIEADRLYVVNSELEILREAHIEDLTFQEVLKAFQDAAPYWRDQWLKELRDRFSGKVK